MVSLRAIQGECMMNNGETRQARIDLLDSLETRDIRHFGRPLKDHLVGTHDLLEQWECGHELCLAGLFHSVYGTRTFKSVTLETTYRQRLRELIGEYAESLVYIFCMSDRKKLLMDNFSEPFFWVNHSTGEKTELSGGFLGDLVELEAANYVEQLPFGTVETDAVFHDMRTRFEIAESRMSGAARDAVRQAIDDHAHLFAACVDETS